MWGKDIVAVATLACMAFCTSDSAAQNLYGDALRYYQRHLRDVLGNVADHVRLALTSRERNTIDGVDVLVPAEDGFTAQAAQQRVVISAGVAWILEAIATATIAEFEFGFEGCEGEYVNYMANEVVSNTKRIADGLSPERAYMPDLYGDRFGGACNGFKRSQIQGEAGNVFAGMMDAGIAFLYLHEMGHHVLGHTQHPPPDLDYSRANEAEADAWAIKTAFAADYNLLAARPMLLFIAAIGGTSLEAERKSTHPLGVRRVHSMMLEAREILVRQGNAKVVEWIDEDLKLIDSLIPKVGE